MRKRHHFLPVFYLKRFTDSSGLLWQFDLRHRAAVNPFQTTPRNAAVESYLYAPGVGPDPRNDDFESWLGSHVDAPSAPVIAKLCADRVLAGHEQLVLARFVVSLRLRTPSHRDKTLAKATRVARRLLEEWRADPGLIREHVHEAYAAGGRSRQEAAIEIAQWEELLDSNEPLGISVLKPLWLDFIATCVRETALLFGEFDYLVFEPPTGEQFVTSDTPVLRRYDKAILRRLLGEPGWLSPNTEISVPLAPNRMLVIGRGREEPIDLHSWWESWRADLVQSACDRLISHERPDWAHLQSAMRAVSVSRAPRPVLTGS